MAKRKQQSDAARSALPTGYVDTSGGGDFPPVWEPEEGETLVGVVQSVRFEDAKRLKRTNAKKGEKVGVVVIADADGVLRSVFESKALETFVKTVNKGDGVFLRYVETKKIGKKRFKVFESGVKSAKGKK